MHTVNVTALRTDLFHVLDEVRGGEVVVVKLKGKAIAKIVPAEATNWREGLKMPSRLLTKPEKAFSPIDDVWSGHV